MIDQRIFAFARHPAVVALGLWAVALGVRLPDLDAALNIDAAWQWYRRTEAFWAALAAGKYADTFQVHPGVTLMWLSGASLKLGPGLGGAVTPAMVAAGAWPVAVVSSLIAPGTWLLWRRFATGPALLAGLLLATEPFLVGHGRTMHLDALLATFAWLGVLMAGIAFELRHLRLAVGAGICLGLAVLTKVAGGAVALGVGGVGLAWVAVGAQRGRRLGVLSLLTTAAVAAVFVLWPALWSDPAQVVERLAAGVTGEVDRGHRVFFDGVYYATDPGAAYYGAVLLARCTPEVLVAAAVGLLVLLRRGPARRAFWLAVAALSVLLVAQLTASKKIDRYVLPFFPLLALAAAHGIGALFDRLPGRRPHWLPAVAVVGLVALRLARLAAVHPHPIAWSQDWPGRPSLGAVTLGFGEGLREAAEFIARDAGSRRPRVFTGMYRPCLSPWLKAHEVPMAEAEYVLRYVSVIQRGFRADEYRRSLRGLLHAVVIDGRVWAEVHAGPTYRGRTPRGLSLPWPAPPEG